MTISNIKLIVGLGNRGICYNNNRHNIGYKIIDNLLKEYQVMSQEVYWNSIYRGPLYIGKKQLVALLKPSMGGMNESGKSVKNTIEEMCLHPSQMIVIHDDISLPLGTIRIRESGSDGGHNGIKSIINEVGIQDFVRLKVGIGMPINNNILDHVLGDFTDLEKDKVSKVISFSSDIVTNILRGVITQGDTFNI